MLSLPRSFFFSGSSAGCSRVKQPGPAQLFEFCAKWDPVLSVSFPFQSFFIKESVGQSRFISRLGKFQQRAFANQPDP
jgi:hypothetical protein